MIKLVVFDLDNVLINTETIDEIAKLNNTENEISEITLQAMQGKIPFEDSIRQRVKKLEGISLNEINEVMDKISLNPGAIETSEALKKQGYKIAIITGSFDVIALKIKELINADYAFYNTLEVKDGKLSGEVSGPLVTKNKLDVLKELIAELDISLDECVAIGDGANDLEMIKNVKVGIAYNAKPILKENADAIINEKDLRKVLDIMTDEEKITKEEETTLEENNEEVESTEVDPEELSEAELEKAEEIDDDEEESSEDVEAEESEDSEVEEDATEESEDTEDSETEDETEEESSEEEKPLIDYSILNFNQLLECKRELEAELTELKNVRDAMNEKTQEFRKERDKLNNELKETLQVALDKRTERDDINKQVRENKELRNECNEQIKKLEWNSGKKEIANIQAEINKIDKTIQTKVLDIRKENELVKRVSDLTKQLKNIQETEEDEKDSEELKELSEQYHQKVVELSDKAQAIHEEMIEYFNNIDGIREKADAKHQEFITSRKNATAKHEEVRAKLAEIKKVNKFMDQAKAKSRGRGRGRGRNRAPEEPSESDIKERETAEEIFQRFKDGKKLTTEEFLLLQKYDIM